MRDAFGRMRMFPWYVDAFLIVLVIGGFVKAVSYL